MWFFIGVDRLPFDWHQFAWLIKRLENTVRKGYLWIPSEIAKSMLNGKVQGGDLKHILVVLK
jgi:hypothetical protein